MPYFFAIILLSIGLLWLLRRRRPTHDRAWRAEHGRLPQAAINGSLAAVRHIRDFRYRSADDFDVRYYDRTFDLRTVKSLDFIHQPFRKWPLAAHGMLSFGFTDGAYLVVSVEARRKTGKKYSAVKGALNFFELIYILADERDVLALRPLYHGDNLYLYPLRADRFDIPALLLDIMRRVNRIKKEPEFYHTLTNACTTNIIRHFDNIGPDRIGLRLPVIVPAYIDRLLFARGLIATDLPYEAARRRFLINDKVRKFNNAPAFSAKIRR